MLCRWCLAGMTKGYILSVEFTHNLIFTEVSIIVAAKFSDKVSRKRF